MKLFDSLTHPILTDSETQSAEAISRELQQHGYLGGCAVALPGMEGYTHKKFYAEITKYSNLFPVASFDLNHYSFEHQIEEIVSEGYRAIKIHPRLSGIKTDDRIDDLKKIFKLCEKHNLIIFYCTYVHDKIERLPLDHYQIILSLLKAAPKVKTVLLHGGDVELMKYCQLARFNENILIDLSYTFLKFEGSSLELDFKFLMKNFDRKICVGSDFPDYDFLETKNRFLDLTNDVSQDKADRIGAENLMSFLGI